MFVAHFENRARVAEKYLVAAFREPKGKGALFRSDKGTARLEKTVENEDRKGASARFVWLVAWVHHAVHPEE